MSICETIKQRLSILDVLAFYGVSVKSHGLARCPLHDDKTASLKVYPNTNTFYCFGCHIGGSVIDLSVNLFGIEPLEACKVLDRDFNLGLFDTPYKSPVKAVSNKSKEQVSDFLEMANNLFNKLCREYRTCKWVLSNCKPSIDTNGDMSVLKLYAHYIHVLEPLEYRLDSLMDAISDYNRAVKHNDLDMLRQSIAVILCVCNADKKEF